MAYPRRSYSSKRRPRRSYNKRLSYTKGASSAFALAKQAAKDIWYLKGLVNSEMKHYIVSATANPDNSTGTVVNLVATAQGDSDVGDREGNSILLRNILIRLAITQNVTATSTFYRIMLVQDTQQIGDTAPTVGNVLNSASTTSSLNTGTAGRFKILKNWFFSTDDFKSNTRNVEYFKDLRLHIRYNGSAASDIQKNGIYLMMLTDQPTNTPSIAYNCKIGYHDN